MAIAFVQKTAKFSSASGSSVAAAALTVTAGNMLVVTVTTWNNSGSHTVTVADDKGNTWNSAVSVEDSSGTGDASKATIYYAMNCAAGSTTVTVSSSLGSTAFEGNVSEFSGLLTASALDVTANSPHNSGGTSCTPTTGTTAQADELVVGVMAVNSADTTCNISDPPSGYTSIGVNQDSNATIGHEGCYKIVSATGTQSATWSFDATTGGDVGVLATFKAAAVTQYAVAWIVA